MKEMVDETQTVNRLRLNIEVSQKYGDRLIQSSSLKEAREVAKKILKAFPSIQTGETRSGLLYDPRWIAHRIVQGFNFLRVTLSKDYAFLPKLVGEIY